jgi:hypothetical protein
VKRVDEHEDSGERQSGGNGPVAEAFEETRLCRAH